MLRPLRAARHPWPEPCVVDMIRSIAAKQTQDHSKAVVPFALMTRHPFARVLLVDAFEIRGCGTPRYPATSICDRKCAVVLISPPYTQSHRQPQWRQRQVPPKERKLSKHIPHDSACWQGKNPHRKLVLLSGLH